jgi:hypothetical protein
VLKNVFSMSLAEDPDKVPPFAELFELLGEKAITLSDLDMA